MAGPPTSANDPDDRGENPAKNANETGESRPQLPENESKVKGWVQKIAQQSTGLPVDQHPQSPGKNDQADPSLWKFAGLGFQFAGTTAIFVLMGVYLDHEMGWTPWGCGRVHGDRRGRQFLFADQGSDADEQVGSDDDRKPRTRPPKNVVRRAPRGGKPVALPRVLGCAGPVAIAVILALGTLVMYSFNLMAYQRELLAAAIIALAAGLVAVLPLLVLMRHGILAIIRLTMLAAALRVFLMFGGLILAAGPGWKLSIVPLAVWTGACYLALLIAESSATTWVVRDGACPFSR